MKTSTSRAVSDLYDLIHALSREEKIYVKNFIKANYRGDGKELLHLFDAYNKISISKKRNGGSPGNGNGALKEAIKEMKSKLSARFKTTSGNKTAKLEFRLYDKILKGLENYHMDRTPSFVIKKGMNRAALLCSKNLYSQAEKCLDKIEDSAKIGMSTYLEFLRLKTQVLKLKGNLSIEERERNLEATSMLNFHQILKYLNETFYLYWGAKLFQSVNRDSQEWGKKFFKTDFEDFLNAMDQQVSYYKNIFKKLESPVKQLPVSMLPELLDENNAIGITSERFSHNALGLYYGLCHREGDKDASNKGLRHIKMEVETFEGDEKKMHRLIYSHDYITVLNNLMNALISIKQYDTFYSEVGKFDAFKEELKSGKGWTSHAEVTLLSAQLAQLLHYIMESGDCARYKNKMMELLPKFQKQELRIKNHFRVYIYLGFAKLYAYQKDFGNASGYIRDILQKKWEPEHGERRDVQYNAAILYPMIEFDKSYYRNKLKNPYAENILVNAIACLKSLKRYGRLERLIISGLRELFNSKKDDIDDKVRSVYNKLLSENISSEFLAGVDILAWLQSKIEGKPWNEIIMEKSGVGRFQKAGSIN